MEADVLLGLQWAVKSSLGGARTERSRSARSDKNQL